MDRNFEMGDLLGRLEKLRELLVFLGHPERSYRTVHIAGTKGKGSTCAILTSILTEAGATVGSFTSPHLYSFLERVTVNGIPCNESDFEEVLFYIRDKIALFDSSLLSELTFFELMALFAFVYFERRSVDFAVIEVGMGGRLDATNICSPSVTVIANISYDHIEQLGPTLTEIAREKGGIIKQGIPLVSSVTQEGPKNVLREIVQSRKAPAYFLDEAFTVEPITVDEPFRFMTLLNNFPIRADIDGLNLRMPGKHQRKNAAIAIAAALLLEDKFILDAATIRNGLAKSFLPVRVEVLQSDSNVPPLVIDGAHNRASTTAFIDSVYKLFAGRRKFLIFGTTLGKDVDGMLTDLVPNFDMIFLTQYTSSMRCFPPTGLRTIIDAILPIYEPKNRPKEIQVINDNSLALQKCLELANPNDVICITGSIYLAAELRKLFLNNIKSTT
ncbi:MAG: hypothetical protein LBQ66_00015 [Planctomycetaceae bacterium]|nr:hypothetical protein [Planctomycetaceae bacterium]